MQRAQRGILAASGLLLALVWVWGVLAGAPTGAPQSAPPAAAGQPCDIRAVTVTAALERQPGLADTRPGAAVNRRVFYAPVSSGTLALSGAITLSAQLNVTPGLACYLYAGAAFGKLVTSEFQLSVTRSAAASVYPVGPGHLTQTVRLDAAASPSGTLTMPHPQAVLTFTPDAAPPVVSQLAMSATAPHLYAAGTTLYYSSTRQGQEFTLLGRSVDAGAGLSGTVFSTAALDTIPDFFVCGIPMPRLSTASAWSATYCLQGAPAPGVITATAYDRVGNSSLALFNYQPDTAPPTATFTTPWSPQTHQGKVALAWQAGDAASGIADITLWYQRGLSGTWVKEGTIWTSGGSQVTVTTGVFTFTAPAGDGLYQLALTARDNVGNLEAAPTVSETQVMFGPYRLYLPITLRDFWPCTPIDAEPNDTFDAAQALPLDGAPIRRGQASGNFCRSDLADYWVITTTGHFLAVNLAVPPGVDLDLHGYDGGRWPVFASATGGDESVLEALRAGQYYLRVQPAGPPGISCAAPYVLTVDDIPQPVVNGGFESGWTGWRRGQGPFGGHGSGLTQTIVLTGSHRALLGNPAYEDGSIPVGYAYISQTLFVPVQVPTLMISYRIHSFDTSFGPGSGKYWDTFEVSLNEPPWAIGDAERNGANGCLGDDLNPNGVTRAPTGDGLVVCGGAPATNQPAAWDSNWRVVRLDLSAFAGRQVTVYLAVWSREYDAPSYDDQGFFNTYVYVDDIEMVLAP